MEMLNLQATKTFAALIAGMTDGYLKITNNPFMPLTIEKIGTGIRTEMGIADQYSLCHYYEQNGDLVQDPEMCFLVLDQRGDVINDFYKLIVVPYTYIQPEFRLFQESITIDESGQVSDYKKEQQNAHTIFANQWLENIREQGFIKHFEP